MKEATLRVSELNLDLRNYRIGQQDGQQEAIKAIIEDQDDRLVNLAEDLLDIGLSPAELLIVTPDEEDDGFYTVLEGNRRITALKLLEVPALASGTSVYADFTKLAPRFAKNPIRQIRCVIMDTKDEAMPWIERRHSNGLDGRGQESWKPRGKANFEADYGTRGKSGVRPSKAVLDLLDSKKMLDSKVASALNRKTTTMDRVFRYSGFGDETGIRFNANGEISFDNGNVRSGLKLLQMLVEDMAKKSWNVETVRYSTQQRDYLRQFSSHAVTNPKPAPVNPTKPSGSTPATTPTSTTPAQPASGKRSPGKSPKKNTLERATLANTRRDLTFHINNQRLNRMYIEARKIKVEGFENSAGVLLRAFLEMSVENYLLRNHVPVPTNLKGKKWNDFGVSLDAKITAVLARIDSTGSAREWKNIRAGLSSSSAPHSVGTLHSFVHNLQTEPEPMQLKRAWEAWEPFLQIVHENTR